MRFKVVRIEFLPVHPGSARSFSRKSDSTSAVIDRGFVSCIALPIATALCRGNALCHTSRSVSSRPQRVSIPRSRHARRRGLSFVEHRHEFRRANSRHALSVVDFFQDNVGHNNSAQTPRHQTKYAQVRLPIIDEDIGGHNDAPELLMRGHPRPPTRIRADARLRAGPAGSRQPATR